MILLSCAAAAMFFTAFDRRIETVYSNNTRDAVFEVKKSFLQYTVENQIARIDSARKRHADLALRMVGEMNALMNAAPSGSREEFIAFFRESFRDGTVWTAALWDPATGSVLYDPDGMLRKGFPGTPDGVEFKDFSAWKAGDFRGLRAFFGISRAAADEAVKGEIASEIHASRFAFDSYIWVNEVVNFDGGQNYAIRRIHPNLRDTEGAFLSTETRDVKGNRPYLTELEGVKKDGSIFFTYFFKRKNSEEISEKLTYAKLYRDFNWIVAMGIHLDDIFASIRKANEESDADSGRLILLFFLLLVALIGISELILLFLEGKFHGESRKGLEDEVNRDPLTGAFSRRAGDRILKKAFQAFRDGESALTGLILFDVDHFKGVNDACGHAGGDEILKQVVLTVQRTVRTSDRLIRWGGDEFLLVAEGIRQENAMTVAEHLVKTVAGGAFSAGGQSVPVTLSMGVASFRPGDGEYDDALKRADDALYRAKTGGRNRANLEI
jgi:diguanylate cyclase (GGDEF)-like protein